MNVASSGISPAARRGTSAAARNATPIARFHAARLVRGVHRHRHAEAVAGDGGHADRRAARARRAAGRRAAASRRRSTRRVGSTTSAVICADRSGTSAPSTPGQPGQPGGRLGPSGTIGAGREVVVERRGGHADRLAVQAGRGRLAEPIASHVRISRSAGAIGSHDFRGFDGRVRRAHRGRAARAPRRHGGGDRVRPGHPGRCVAAVRAPRLSGHGRRPDPGDLRARVRVAAPLRRAVVGAHLAAVDRAPGVRRHVRSAQRDRAPSRLADCRHPTTPSRWRCAPCSPRWTTSGARRSCSPSWSGCPTPRPPTCAAARSGRSARGWPGRGPT